MLTPVRCHLITRRGTGGAASFTSPAVMSIVLIFAKQNGREVLHVLLLRTKAVPHGSRVDVLDPTQAVCCPSCLHIYVSSSCRFDGSIDCPYPGSWIILPYGMKDSDVPSLLNAL